MALPRAQSADNISKHNIIDNTTVTGLQEGNSAILGKLQELSTDTAVQIRSLHEELIKERLERQYGFAYLQTLFSDSTPPNNGDIIGQRPITGQISHGSPTLCAAADVQGDFKSLRDSLNAVRLETTLKLNDSRAGIKREDNITYNNLAKSARYVETTLKLLSKLKEPSTVTLKHLEDITLVQVAHMKYLQDEYSALIVQGSNDKETGNLFRQFTNNTSGLSPVHSVDGC